MAVFDNSRRWAGRHRGAARAHGAVSSRARRAMVLVLVLIVVVMIALAGFSFAELMLTENKAVHLHGDQLRLDHAVGSGIEFLKMFCEQSPEQQAEAGGAFNNPLLMRAVAFGAEDARTRPAPRAPRFSIVAPLGDDAQEGGIRFGVENESGRLHLADLLNWERQQPGSGRTAFLNFPGMTPAVADAILDWIDADSQPREGGAESDYYLGLEPPYAPRNGLPECLEELLLVKGVTRELLFGGDANYNYQVDPGEQVAGQSRAGGQQIAAMPWSRLITLTSGRRNLNSAGQPRIDLNGMDLAKLQRDLTAALDANWAAFIVAYRQFGPYAGPGSAAGGAPAINTATPAKYSIGSVLDLAGARISLPGATPQQPATIHASPMSDDPSSLSQELPKLMDNTTVANVPVIRGGVSVNDAPVAVLRAVPGIDEALAQRIVAARAQATDPQPNRRYATWLVCEGVVDLATMKKLMPNVCGGGDVVRAQVVGHFEDKGPTARVEVVIDATSRPARELAWRDLRFYGAGYPREWLTDEAESPRGERGRQPTRKAAGARPGALPNAARGKAGG